MEAGGPRAEAVEGLAAESQAASQDTDRPSRLQLAAVIGLRKIGGEEPVEAETTQHGVDHRQPRHQLCRPLTRKFDLKGSVHLRNVGLRSYQLGNGAAA